MALSSFLDAPVAPRFCSSLPAAEVSAVREAADTGATVMRVKSIKVQPDCLVIAGQIPSGALALERPSEFPGYVQPRAIGGLHLTWASLLRPNVGELIGYLALETPVAAAGLLPESEDEDSYWVALAIRRLFRTLPDCLIGAAFCALCNRPISIQRQLAVPNTRICFNCQQKKERTR